MFNILLKAANRWESCTDQNGSRACKEFGWIPLKETCWATELCWHRQCHVKRSFFFHFLWFSFSAPHHHSPDTTFCWCLPWASSSPQIWHMRCCDFPSRAPLPVHRCMLTVWREIQESKEQSLIINSFLFWSQATWHRPYTMSLCQGRDYLEPKEMEQVLRAHCSKFAMLNDKYLGDESFEYFLCM